MRKRRRSFDPLASQPRTPTRRPGDFNEQADSRLDPNTQFIPTHASGVGGHPVDWAFRLFRALGRRFSGGPVARRSP